MTESQARTYSLCNLAPFRLFSAACARRWSTSATGFPGPAAPEHEGRDVFEWGDSHVAGAPLASAASPACALARPPRSSMCSTWYQTTWVRRSCSGSRTCHSPRGYNCHGADGVSGADEAMERLPAPPETRHRPLVPRAVEEERLPRGELAAALPPPAPAVLPEQCRTTHRHREPFSASSAACCEALLSRSRASWCAKPAQKATGTPKPTTGTSSISSWLKPLSESLARCDWPADT
mmetsp:Transcript_98301/g.277974  ORF Transcript_98301/g.277974 Transcript_98301/m.277974 type:complete len:236 (-) Transcript_98301:154-861(-)